MKILFFRESEQKELNPDVIDEGFGATENTLIYSAEYLSRIDNYEVKVCCPCSKRKYYNKVEYIPHTNYKNFISEMDKFQPAFIVVLGNPKIISYCDLDNFIFWQHNHPLEMKSWDIPKILNKVKRIVFPSYSSCEYARSYYKNEEKIVGIYNGIRQQFLQERNIERKENKILYVGSFVWNKGLLELLKISHLLSDYEIEICGDFDMYGKQFVDQKFKNTCLELIKKNNIIFNGKLSTEELAKKLRETTICVVNPWVGNLETCCLSGLEAMASGAPVVVGGKSLIGSIMENGGVVCKEQDQLAETIINLMKDKNKRDKLSKSGHQWARHLTWDYLATRWNDLFRRIYV